MKKFYYKTVVVKSIHAFNLNFPLKEVEEELNRLGQLGWELVSTVERSNPVELILFLKNDEGNLNS